jgi:hypothetical protein
MDSSILLLVSGEPLEVEGSVEETAKALENAARSSVGTLAWLIDPASGEPLGVNPLQVVTLRAAKGE